MSDVLSWCGAARDSADPVAAQSRGDDLEALGYMLVYFMRGKLPWQGLKAKRDAKYLQVLEKKQVTSPSELCAGLPSEFEDYMTYVRSLQDEDQPDYQGLRKMFDKLFREQGFELDSVYDWTIREFQRLEPAAQAPPASYGTDDRLAVDTVEPSDCGVLDVPRASRRKRKRRPRQGFEKSSVLPAVIDTPAICI